MAHLVNITARAERDFADLYTKIQAEHSEAALKWYRSFKQAVLSLEERPNRCALIRKRDSLRHLLYGHKPHIYRVIYRVVNDHVTIYLIVDGRRDMQTVLAQRMFTAR